MNTQAIIVGAMLAHRGYGEIEEVPVTVQEAIVAEAAAVAEALPANAGLDFLSVMETWGDSEANTTAALLDMVIAATLIQMFNRFSGHSIEDIEIILTSAELRAVLEQYHIERAETDGSWTIKVQKISEMSST